MSPLIQRFSDRIVYDAASSVNAKVADFIHQNEWNRPRALSNDLIQWLVTGLFIGGMRVEMMKKSGL